MNAEKLDNQKKMAEVRSSKQKRSIENYRALTFIEKDSRDKLLKKVKKINDDLSILDLSSSEKAYAIGEMVTSFKDNLERCLTQSKNKFSLSTCYEVHFGKNIRRINEFSAAYLAVKKGGDKKLPITINILLGQLLNSKNEEKKEAAIKILQNQMLEDGTSLKSIKVKDLPSLILPPSDEDFIKKLLSQAESSISSLKSLSERIRELILASPPSFPLKGEINLKINSILKSLNDSNKSLEITLDSLLTKKPHRKINHSNQDTREDISDWSNDLDDEDFTDEVEASEEDWPIH